MPAIPIIRRGEDLEFVFDLDGEDISGWICTIFVKRFPQGSIFIEREISPEGREWPGFLTSEETMDLDESSESPYFLTGKLTNSTTNQERQIPKRFHVSPSFASIPSPFTPSDIPGLVGWYDASDEATIEVTGSLVNAWLDKSGFGNTVTATLGDRPKTGTKTINGMNALEFDGSNDFLEASSFFTEPDLTIAVVFGSIVVDSNNDSIISFNENVGSNGFQIDADNNSQYFGDVNSVGIGNPNVQSPIDLIGPTIALMYRFDTSDASVRLFNNNIEVSQDIGNYTGALNNDLSFKIAANRGAGQHLGCNIGEVLVINRAITEQERLNLFIYFERWGV